ncbi:DUF916 and DUF3324 domain-containing protein [Vagococcus fessus]|nr:DUF916 and DUF3324 domain-containing protein [Vagococcus fessus]
MKTIIKILTTCLLGITLFTAINTEKVQASVFNFAVIPQIPDNQLDGSKSYFDLLLKKGEKETLKVDLTNSTDKEITILTTLNSATTNINGVVEYGINKIKPDDSLIYNLKDYAKIPKEIKIPKKGKQTLSIELTSPSENFDGVLAGGITFKEKTKEKKEDAEAKGLSIKNEFSYMVALLVRQHKEAVAPHVNLLDAFPSQVNARNVLNATLQNNQATFINQVKISTSIVQRGKKDVMYETMKSGLQIAPNSRFDFPTPLEGKELKPGKYTMNVMVFGGKHQDGKYKDEESETYRHRWILSKDFEISKDEAKELNSKDVDIKPSHTLWYVGGGSLLLLLLLVLLLLKKKRQDKEETDSDDSEEE